MLKAETKIHIKSKNRVRDKGEVFTAEREVNAMLNLVRHETERIDSRFLEPACGDGNFLAPILERKLCIAEKRYKKDQLEFERNAIIAIGSLYGVDILKDNVIECRNRLYSIFLSKYKKLYGKKIKQAMCKSVNIIIDRNILWGDALSLKTPDEREEPIVFSEWNITNGSFIKRRDFTLANMLENSPLPETGGQAGQFSPDELRPTPIAEFPLINFLKIGEL